MKLRNMKMNYEYLAACVFFVPMFIIKGLGMGGTDKLAVIITFISLLCSIIPIVTSKYSRNEIIIWSVILAFLLVNMILSGKYIVFMSAYALFLLSHINCKRFIKFLFPISILILIILIILNIDQGSLQIRYISGEWQNITKRSNGIFVAFYTAVNLYILQFGRKIKKLHILVIFVLTLLLFFYTGSRTGCVCSIILCIMLFFARNKRLLSNMLVRKIIVFLPILFPLVSIGTNYMYGKITFLFYLNSMLQNRLYYGKFFLDHYGFSLLGQKIVVSYNEATYQVMDNTYLNLFINYGIIVGILWMIINIRTLKLLLKDEQYNCVCIIVGYMFYAISESFVIVLFVNMSVFLYCSYIQYLKDKRSIRKCKKI